jgi:hypothetical protein
MGMVVLLSSGLVQAQSVVDQINAHQHLGVATCASSVCHGATQPFKESPIWQNEYSVWSDSDPHAKAYQTLLNADSRRIARNLGIANAATAKMCLDCHTDNVPADKQGDKYLVTDGVGCEACHGGSENWIASHTSRDASHADNLGKGLYPTEEPVARAKLCLTCHMGTKDRMITHKIMGAGHPRLSFELDTFTWLNPHYEIDEDYVERKGQFNGARDWAIGQGVAAYNLLDMLTDEQAGWHGIFPELVLFDCHACHRVMSGQQWGPRPGTGLGPGVVRLNDANLVMFRHVLSLVDSAGAARLAEQTRNLHQATTQSRSATMQAAATLKRTLDGALAAVAGYDFNEASLGQILQSMQRDAEKGEFRDFASAEQAAMAAQSVIVAFDTAGRLDEARAEQLRILVDRLYKTVEKEDSYRMNDFIGAFRQVVASAN